MQEEEDDESRARKRKLIFSLFLLLSRTRDPVPVRNRCYYGRKDPEQSPWFQEYWFDECNTYSATGTEYKQKQFKNMFIILKKAELSEFVNFATEELWFPLQEGKDAIGRRAAPIELLVMGCLAMLRNHSTNYLPSLTYISSQKFTSFFKIFCKTLRERFYPMYVKSPSTEEEIASAMKGYTDAGFPGVIGSADGVRVRMWNCSYNLKNQNINGKQGVPTRLFDVVVSFTTEIFHTTKSYDGAKNDFDISAANPFLKKFRRDGEYTNIEWKYLDGEGVECSSRGLALLSDNGYCSSDFVLCPLKSSPLRSEKRWSKMCESLRKDVERTFGILKQRFRILKYGINLQEFEAIDECWFCCALHNFILKSRRDEFEVQNLETEEAIASRIYKQDEENEILVETSKRSRTATNDAAVARRTIVIKHFNYLFDKRAVLWTRLKINE